ncbi:hypothetical protein LCGC14_0248690 [marine sediment metagenome]|uniref:Uncharacterized protein n=1 Tax=marine sediment metagenome TaxID=412755 RepID=A0A0F9ULK0_9ZZZZ
MSNWKETILGGMAMGISIILLWIAFSWIEARQYNRLTGGNATTLDAMFIQLRVQGKEKET